MTQSTDIAVRQVTQSAVAQLQDDEFAQQIQLAVPEGVSPRQLLRAAATAVLETPELAQPALRASLLQATLKCAQDGLLPDGREAVFVIYKTRQGDKIQYQSMIGGLRKIAADHGWALAAHVVYENDGFEPDVDAHRANHKPTPLGKDRGKPIGAYAIAEHRDGRRVGPEIFSLDDIEKVRQVSRAKDRGPWVDWWERMAQKTAAKRLFKELPLDPKDRRIASVLNAFADEDPVNALYGPEGEFVEDEQPERDGAIAESDWHEADAADLNEPSDEELAALGGASNDDAPEQPVEFRFDRGKFKGQTFAQIHAQGQVGIGYLRWALRDWQDEGLKAALREFADEHPEVRGE